MYKFCPSCKENKCIDSFGLRLMRGKHYLNSRCKICDLKARANTAKERYKKRKEHVLNLSKQTRIKNKQYWINKLGGKCQDCGGIFPSYVYDFHHLDPNEKEYSPGQILDRKKEIVDKELSKCVLLCANCHRIRHKTKELV